MENDKVKKIISLSEKIDKITFKTTYYFDIKKRQMLNYFDKQMLGYYQKILDLIIELAKEENTRDIEIINKKYFLKEDNATSFLQRYMSLLRFYSNLDSRIFEKQINVIEKIQLNLSLTNEFETKNQISLGNCYFQVGKEAVARKIMLEWIKDHPDEEEAYMCMQNWYMDVEPNIHKLAQVIDLAEANNHFLSNDLGYTKVVNFYSQIGDLKNKERYQKIYENWIKRKRMESR